MKKIVFFLAIGLGFYQLWRALSWPGSEQEADEAWERRYNSQAI